MEKDFLVLCAAEGKQRFTVHTAKNARQSTPFAIIHETFDCRVSHSIACWHYFRCCRCKVPALRKSILQLRYDSIRFDEGCMFVELHNSTSIYFLLPTIIVLTAQHSSSMDVLVRYTTKWRLIFLRASTDSY